jgi:hypothetical protein
VRRRENSDDAVGLEAVAQKEKREGLEISTVGESLDATLAAAVGWLG